MTNAEDQKKSLRQALLTARGEIVAQERVALSRAINAHLASFLRAKAIANPGLQVFGFTPFRGEADLRDLPLLLGPTTQLRFGLPVVDQKAKSMNFFSWRTGEPLKKGAYGIEEPESLNREALVLDKNAVVLVPTLAATPSGDRLGYGGGYYDRYLSGEKQQEALVLGVLYSAFLRGKIPVEPHDQKLHGYVTEKGITLLAED
jgi:5-formyltetrahydrofolate cyclo-ligase